MQRVVLVGLLSCVFGALQTVDLKAETIIKCPSIQDQHPVCKAAFTARPAGSVKSGDKFSGTATVNGKNVNWTCFGSTSGVPRSCKY